MNAPQHKKRCRALQLEPTTSLTVSPCIISPRRPPSSADTTSTTPLHHRPSRLTGAMDVLEVKEGTETYLVAKRDLVAGEVLFDCSPGTLSSERSRYSIQVAADQHLTVCDNLDYINHGCTPNCQLELVKSPSGKVGVASVVNRFIPPQSVSQPRDTTEATLL